MNVFKIYGTGDDETISMKSFESIADVNSDGNSGHIIKTAEALQENPSITTGMMLTLFNELTGENVAKFSNKESAARRTFKAMCEKAGVDVPAKVKSAKADKPAKAAKPAKAPKAPKVKKEKGERKERAASTDVYECKAKENPYHEGGDRHKAFALIEKHPGLTAKELIAKGAKPAAIGYVVKHGTVKKTKG